ncbi:phosphoribosylformimino-5-aminoimidazole carboxamide ribotide isomerase [Halorhodospira halochloris]|uniref:1-(5-phosphoribosyl)-5-[(5-phosphoribosylamino)methylideneamino] imidazole-4-carboxamide isomerase n=1 Tax=Halorhodospira halochloris TaxID=1052 RepID=A0A110B4I1_HALHR|nr:1-(5-phosphoribosyl)-5-[(5-phosphoribosylamino)methylideneamino]imidazole-4-carboxamide isomerase [Halorhodospira halochloris]MBK1650736.1 1-(5-phosphoribosyl)-5-[(5-phosphoribosylamino)methylideneamino]imidazole-4-carboxamide isomerase [Halorhodospira halochloris]BAU56771.2 phosphoribosylformimino-5-aminoimidazole carboxamide ribotide isomerase [Halorhodospira halochloris]
MIVIPAIDLKGGKCVRLRQGRMDDETIYADDPIAVAERWAAAGAERLHLVDLDGAVKGEPAHEQTVHAIARANPQLKLQIGGGVRSRETVERYLNAGVGSVIIGTRAVREPEFVEQLCRDFPQQVCVGLDARGGYIATHGWEQTSDVRSVDLAQRFAAAGVAALIFTDIGRDGMLQGCNIEATRELARSVSIPVIASGGVSSEAEIRTLAQAPEGIAGAIVGRAIYAGELDLGKAIAAAREARA